MDAYQRFKTCSRRESRIKRLLSEREIRRVLDYLQADESEDGCPCADPLPSVSTASLAVRCGDVDVVRAVIDNGFSPDEPSEEEEGVRILPLHIAICLRMTDVVKLLIEVYNVKRNIGKHKTGRALFWAIYSESLQMVKYLVNLGEFFQPCHLHTCIDLNRRSICEYILTKGIWFNQVSKNLTGHTPLYSAVTQGRADIVVMLLQAGADMGGIFSRGNTLLHQAVISGDLNTVQVLCTRGAQPHLRNSSGNSPLHLAALYGFHDIVHYLINDLGVDLCVTDVDDQTPFVLALLGRNIPIARMLVWAGYRPSVHELEFLIEHLNIRKCRDMEFGNPVSLQSWCVVTIRQYIDTRCSI